MSQPLRCGRVVPRWSTAGQPSASAASIAALTLLSACVFVGPPLSASGPMFDLRLRSPAAVNRHESPSSMLWPSDDVNTPEPAGWLPEQFVSPSAVLSVTSELWKRLIGPALSLNASHPLGFALHGSTNVNPPPPLPAAVLLATVLFWTLRNGSPSGIASFCRLLRRLRMKSGESPSLSMPPPLPWSA